MDSNFWNNFINWRIFCLICLFFLPFNSFSQFTRKTKVIFPSVDGLEITADHYYSKKSNPYIILFHQEGASRGEFKSIADRFIKMNYNCLAVDLRSGERYGFVINETASRAREKSYSNSLIESLKDIKASISYIKKLNSQPLILLGSSSSASLSLIAGMDDENVRAVIAFSPGEFFLPEIEMTNINQQFNKPLFIGVAEEETSFVKNIFNIKDKNNITFFQPSEGPGKRSAEALHSSNRNNEEYWLALIIFMRSLR